MMTHRSAMSHPIRMTHRRAAMTSPGSVALAEVEATRDRNRHVIIRGVT